VKKTNSAMIFRAVSGGCSPYPEVYLRELSAPIFHRLR